MKATDKQIKYLQYLADKVEAIKVADPTIKDLPKYIDWNIERNYGVTMEDASIRIDAYKTIIRSVNTIRLISNKGQFVDKRKVG